jgi:hypothetical protein
MTTAKLQAPRKAAPLDYTRPIWYRQEGETEAAYASFKKYRDMEKRKIRDCPNGNNYSTRWSWRERVEAWDKHMADNEANELVRYRIAMGERHRALGRKALEKAEMWLDSLTEDRISRMSANGIVQMMDVAARIEREAAGAGADAAKVQVEISSNLAEMTATATTSRIEQLVAEVERRKREQGLIDAGPAELTVLDTEDVD